MTQADSWGITIPISVTTNPHPIVPSFPVDAVPVEVPWQSLLLNLDCTTGNCFMGVDKNENRERGGRVNSCLFFRTQSVYACLSGFDLLRSIALFG